MKDDLGQEIERREYNQKDMDRILVLNQRTKLVAKRVMQYLRATNPFDKTIIFCEDIDHAERMRAAIVNAAGRLALDNPKYVHYVALHEMDDSDKDITLPANFIRALALGPGHDELCKLEENRRKRGATAGLMLTHMLILAKAGHDAPSQNKAIHFVETIATDFKRKRLDTDLYADEKEIRASWKLMKSCAHLWASREIISSPVELENLSAGPHAVVQFLRLAAGVRQFGCSFRESNTKEKKTILDPEASMRLPAWIEEDPIEISEGVIPDQIKEVLEKYRAPFHL